ncbi:MAG: putative transposase [Gammaproteobacteria bacterium]|jgi:putative transposase
MFPVATINQSYYILMKDLNRGNLFFESKDYHQFICLLKKSVIQYGCLIHAYSLMLDHIHLLITHKQREAINQLVIFVQGHYSEYFNFTHRRIKKLLDPGHTIDIVNQESDLLSYYRFIELRPARNGTVAHPADYPWSSYGSNALGEDTGLITPHNSYISLGTDEPSRWRAYRELFEQTQSVLVG